MGVVLEEEWQQGVVRDLFLLLEETEEEEEEEEAEFTLTVPKVEGPSPLALERGIRDLYGIEGTVVRYLGGQEEEEEEEDLVTMV